MLVTIAAWSFGNAIEISSVSLSGKLLGLQISYTGISLLPAACFLWICAYTGRPWLLSSNRWLWFTLIPVISVALVWSSAWHDFFWESPVLRYDPDGFVRWSSNHPFWWKIHAAYSYGMILAGVGVIVLDIWREPWSRPQLSMMLAVTLFPTVPSLLFVTGLTEGWLKIDFTSTCFAVTLAWFAFLESDDLRRRAPVSREKLLFELGIAVFLLDLRGEMISTNPSARKLLNEFSEDKLRQAASALFEDDLNEDPSGMISIFNGYETKTLEVRSRIIRDRNHSIFGIIVLMTDRTIETALQLSLKETVERISARTDGLAEAGDANTRFVANLTHELRAPLSSIVGFSELIKDGLVDDVNLQAQTLASEIYDSANNLLLQIGNILDFEKSYVGALTIHRMPTDPITMINGVIGRIKHRSAVPLYLRTSEQAISASLDPDKFTKILYNLLSFIVMSTPQFGKIYITTRLQGPHLIIDITQMGLGVRAPTPSEWLNPFATEPSHGRQRENFIGMALILRLLELHECNFSVTQPTIDWVKYHISLIANPTVEQETTA